MKKLWMPTLAVVLAGTLLYGCSDKNEEPGKPNEEKLTSESTYDKLYGLADDAVLLKVGDSELTVREVKERTFEQGLTVAINQFVDQQRLLSEYEVTDEEVKKEAERRKEAMENSTFELSLDDNDIRYSLAYEQALKVDDKVSNEDLKDVYNKYFAPTDKRSFEEMKEELKIQAPRILASEKMQEQNEEYRKTAKVEFLEPALENLLKDSFNQDTKKDSK